MKGKLVLIGMGMGDENGISLRGLASLTECDSAFAESYTNLMPPGTLSRLEILCKKKIALLPRSSVESEKELLESAKKQSTALLVSGDPMIATTHVSLLLSAKKQGIATDVVHGASILSAAIGESGLQAYKFGKIVTLAYWRDNYKPMSAYDVIAENLSRNLHTLLLLDIDEKLGPMKPSVAAQVLIEMEKEGKKKIFVPDSKVILLKGIGWKQSVKKYCKISELSKFDGKDGPAVIIIPSAKPHFMELEWLEQL